MSILLPVEKKGWKGRLFLSGVTAVLILGGLTMLYPFLLMVSGAMRSEMDAADMQLVPAYLVDDVELVQKFLETKYNYDPVMLNRFRQERSYRFRDAQVPPVVHEPRMDDFVAFVLEAEMPVHWQILGGTVLRRGISCVNHRHLVHALRQRFAGDLARYNVETGAPLQSWWQVSMPTPRWEEARTVLPADSLMAAYGEVLAESHPSERALVNLTGLFLERMVYPEFGMLQEERFAVAYGPEVGSYDTFVLPERVPPEWQARFRADWLRFVFDGHLNLSFVRSDATDAEYQAFVAGHFGTMDQLHVYWRDADYTSFADVQLPDDRAWVPDSRRAIYRSFLQSLPPESLRLVGPEYAWRQFLSDRYGSVAALSDAHAYDYSDWAACRFPLAELEKHMVLQHAGRLRWRYATRNFRIVAREMFVQGRPFMNTIIFVVLALLFALTLQPVLAYSLSRFQPPGTWKILFLFLATMAFPPMVGMIPQFLIIQRLQLLNTFVALLLPVMINGMLIFLLKGFFDSIPRDLYDAAMIDGASELRIFWQITMSMSKPILAVVGLQTFSAVWMMFMYPLIVCPAPEMHVLAVWLQQFQLHAPGTAVYASIILASIPSLLIFVFAQRTIMRGIAVPSEK